jgi:hypothetical protein
MNTFTQTYDALSKLNTEEESLPPPTSLDQNGNIQQLVYASFLTELKRRSKKRIQTAALNKFFNSLGKDKSGSKNGIGRGQEFCNAYLEETTLKKANPEVLVYVNEDHDSLTAGDPGTNDPDFYFYTKANGRFKVEVKMYITVDSYYSKVKTTNFHDADYVISYIIDKHVWLFSTKEEQYLELYTQDNLAATEPWINEINLPSQLETVSFYIPENQNKLNKPLRDYTNEELPKVVNYNFFINKAKSTL